MKSFSTFQEDLTDRRQQALQKQKIQKQKSAEKGAQSRAAFQKQIVDKEEEVKKRERKIKEREEIKNEVRKEMLGDWFQLILILSKSLPLEDKTWVCFRLLRHYAKNYPYLSWLFFKLEEFGMK